jgi:predicted nucleotide-binding protein
VFGGQKGNAALTQDWATGSFSTYINDIEHRAFGLSFVREDIELMIPADFAKTTAMPAAPGNKVFLVHGRDEAAKNEVAMFLRAIGLDPVILHLRPNGSRHLLTKFREESEGATFAVVLMTADDVGGIAEVDAGLQPRARQNVSLASLSESSAQGMWLRS